MICLGCNNETDFHVEERNVEQLFHGRTLFVPSHVTVCSKCGWFTVGNDQIDELLKNTREAYENNQKSSKIFD
jgi:hypothetical protein